MHAIKLTFSQGYLILCNLYDENGKYIGKIQGDTFLKVETGLKYYFTLQ